MAIEFKIPPSETRKMDAVDIELYMKMLSAYKAIIGSENSKSVKNFIG